MLTAINRKVDTSNKRLDRLETNQRVVESKVDMIAHTNNQRRTTVTPPAEVQHQQTEQENQNLPDQIPFEQLQAIKHSSKTAGNFSKKIVEVLFPELFGPDHLRLNYSFYGGHGTDKHELDPARRDVIQTYVAYYFPEMKNFKEFRKECVNKINEGLRRPLQKKTKRQSLVEVTAVLQNIS